MSIEYGTLPAVAEPLTAEQQLKRREAVRDLMTNTPSTDADGNVVAHAVQTYRIV